VVSVSDWLKVRIFRFESPETQNKKPKIILISKIYFKKFTVNKQRYFTMFTKLNRVLLASGLAIASAALLSPAAFADTAVGVINAQIGTNNAISSANFTGSFNFPSPNVGVTNQPLGTINIKTNNAAGFTLEAYSLNGVAAGDAAQLELVSGGVTYPIQYTVTLGGGAQP
jgi:hypothetical protein